MVSYDKKLIRVLSKIGAGYDDLIFYDPAKNVFRVVGSAGDDNATPSPVPAPEVPAALSRLAADDFVKLSDHPAELYFSVTPYLMHRVAFMADEIKTAFLRGFASGFVAALATAAVVAALTYIAGLWRLL